MRSFSLLLACLASFVAQGLAGLEDAKYSTVLTSSNFDSKLQEPGVGTLTAFFAPWCGHCKSLEPTWTNIAKAFESEPKCKVAHFNADEAKNKPIASRYGVSGFPTIKFLPSGGLPAVDYAGPRTEDAFISFLNKQCGTHRVAGGSLSDQAGRLPALDELASKYISASTPTRAELISSAKALAATLNDTATNVYLRTFEKLTNDDSYLVKEADRIKKLLEKKTGLAADKVDQLQIKSNILKAFEAVKEKAGEAKEKVEDLVNQVKAEL